MRVLPNGNLNASAVPLLALVSYADDVPVNPSPRLSALPGWRETYDIEATAPASETEGWKPLRLPPPPPPSGNPPVAGFDDLPTIFTVLRTLGLELKKQEATVPVYVLKHIERPAAETAAAFSTTAAGNSHCRKARTRSRG